jgi:phage terminase Nu1 subunit (DNA packaging protein)
MDQKISVKIAGGTYNLTAHSPEQEELYRLAAEVINKRFATYTRSHPGKTVADILCMVALNETVVRLGLQKDMDRFASEEKTLEEDLARYLQDITK